VSLAPLQFRESEYLQNPESRLEVPYEQPAPPPKLGALHPRDFDHRVFEVTEPSPDPSATLFVDWLVAPKAAELSRQHPRDFLMRSTAQRLERENRVTAKIAQGLFSTWLEVRRQNPEVTLPLTQVTEDGTVQMAWQIGPRYVDIEVHGPNELEWFFQDRSSGEHASSGENLTRFSDKLADYLRRVFSDR
jgi:hypothetical protein